MHHTELFAIVVLKVGGHFYNEDQLYYYDRSLQMGKEVSKAQIFAPTMLFMQA